MTTEWCIGVLEEAIACHGKPEIINSDQGSQFTADKYVELLKANEIQISMDGKGRALDNVFIERLWRSVKQEYQSFLQTKLLNQNEDLKNFISDIKRMLSNSNKRHIRTRVYPDIMTSYLEFETKIGYIPQAKIGVEFNFISNKDFDSLENIYNLKDYWLFDDQYLFLMNYSPYGEFISIEKCLDEKIIKSAISLKDASFEKSKTLSFFLNKI